MGACRPGRFLDDLCHLPAGKTDSRHRYRPSAPVTSIGGADTFDGIFLNGILAVLLATLLM